MGRAPRSKPMASKTPRFTKSELREMEKLLLEHEDKSFDQTFCQKLTRKFNAASRRRGSNHIEVKQVQTWLQNRQKNQEAKSTPTVISDEEDHEADASLSNNAPEKSPDVPQEIKDKAPDVLELEFEAKSARDSAWYDVTTFLAHRVVSTGEPEVRVRFQGFGAEEDEWVNVKKAVRERSIPLESSECQKVEVGHLVLCFRETSDQATYFDAHVLDIQRRVHDIRGCRCLFLIRYDHDQTEEHVHLTKLCRRPS